MFWRGPRAGSSARASIQRSEIGVSQCLGQKLARKPRQVSEIVQQSLWFQCRHVLSSGPEGHEHGGYTRSLGGGPVGIAVAHENTIGLAMACAAARLEKRCGIGLANGQRIGADQRLKPVPHAQPLHQRLGQTLWLVGTNAHTKAGVAQFVHRLDRTRIQFRMDIDRRGIGLKQHRIVGIDQPKVAIHPREPGAQHHAPAPQCDTRIAHRIQHITQPHLTKTDICRRDQIAAGIRERSIQIENHCRHIPPLRQKTAAPCCRRKPKCDAALPCVLMPSG